MMVPLSIVALPMEAATEANEDADEPKKRTSAGDSNEDEEDEEVNQTPPPSPTEDGEKPPSIFSLSQVSMGLSALWTSARESIFGEDYWIPTDHTEIAFFPKEILETYKVVYPVGDTARNLPTDIRVVKGPLKSQPSLNLHHLVYTVGEDNQSYSLFRSIELNDAVDLCLRCHECLFLFRRLEPKRDSRADLKALLKSMRDYPLWKMLHIAIASNREDIFTPETIEALNKEDKDCFKRLTETMAQPEGKYPLHIAIEQHRVFITRRMLEEGCDPGIRDLDGNTAMHYAATASVQMIELLWSFDSSRRLLNETNNEGAVPVTLAIRSGGARCLASLLSYGAEMSIRVAGRNPLMEAMQGGKGTDIIKALLEASPELLKERDALGNTALHVATTKPPLLGILYLKADDLDLNVKNEAGQAPIHLYTTRGDIGLVVAIASYNCNIDEPDKSGNTALHIAVSKENTEATRLLLCLGADPNVRNNVGDTPRHLAARLKHRDILRSLVLCRAARCEQGRTGCVSCCAHTEVLTAIKNGATTPSEEEPSSPKLGKVMWDMECEDEEPVEAETNDVHTFTQEMVLKRVLAHLEELEKRGEKARDIVNLLSLDGGGIRGLVMMQTLLSMEQVLGESVFPYFDWVAGTSTGGMIAAALAQGKTVRECQHVYLRFKDLIFEGWTRPFNTMLVEQFMQSVVGKGSMAEIREPRLMLTTAKCETYPVKLELMRNYRLPLSDGENDKLGFSDPREMPVWKAMRRTSAAPMYFSPVDDKFIDGGLISNNPTLDLLSEVQLYNNTMEYLNRSSDRVSVGMVLSLGTGQLPPTSVDPLNVELFRNPISAAYALKSLSLILVDQATATEGAPVDRSIAFCNAIGAPYFRLSAQLQKDISLVEKDDHILAEMMWDCVEYAYEHKCYIRRICDILKRIGKRDARGYPILNGRTRSMETQTSKNGLEKNQDTVEGKKKTVEEVEKKMDKELTAREDTEEGMRKGAKSTDTSREDEDEEMRTASEGSIRD